MRTLLPVALLVSLFAALWLAGLRVIVAPPSTAYPDGATLIVQGMSGAWPVDSLDALCIRAQGGVSELCRTMFLAPIVSGNLAVATLPGAPWLAAIPETIATATLD